MDLIWGIKSVFVNYRFCAIIVFIFCCAPFSFADEASELKSTVKKLQKQLDDQRLLIDDLIEKIAVLENQKKIPPASEVVSKTGEAAEKEAEEGHVLSKEWFRRFEVNGFGAAGLLSSGHDTPYSNGGFLNYEARLFLDASVWEDVYFFTELQIIKEGDENTKWVRAGEIYVEFYNFLKDIVKSDILELKLGRASIPYGLEHTVHHYIVDNPLITYSAGYPHGHDEGVMAHIDLGGVGVCASVMDGSAVRGRDDSSDKAFNIKLAGKPTELSCLSASFMRNGEAAESAMELGGSSLRPVGSGGLVSALGASPSSKVESYLYEVAAQFGFRSLRGGYVFFNFGQGFIDDKNSFFDRRITYFILEPLFYLVSNKLYLVSRFSGIGTFNDAKGYTFEGGSFSAGNSRFGYDTKSLTRWAIGLGYKPNPNILMKLEYSQDYFEVIKASTKEDDRGGHLLGAQVAVKF